MKNHEIEKEMQLILNENEILREKITIGHKAQENYYENNLKLQQLTKVYNNDLGILKVTIRELKNIILDEGYENVPKKIEEIEKLLEVR